MLISGTGAGRAGSPGNWLTVVHLSFHQGLSLMRRITFGSGLRAGPWALGRCTAATHRQNIIGIAQGQALLPVVTPALRPSEAPRPRCRGLCAKCSFHN